MFLSIFVWFSSSASRRESSQPRARPAYLECPSRGMATSTRPASPTAPARRRRSGPPHAYCVSSKATLARVHFPLRNTCVATKMHFIENQPTSAETLKTNLSTFRSQHFLRYLLGPLPGTDALIRRSSRARTAWRTSFFDSRVHKLSTGNR